MTRDELFSTVKNILINDFDIEENLITENALINDDLDLDSIDAVEMIVKMKPYLNGNVQPDVFKSVKTVDDVVNVLLPLSK